MSEHESPILDRRRGLYAPERLLTLVDGVFAISTYLLPRRGVAYVPLVWFVLVGVDPLAHRLYRLLRRRATGPADPAR